MYILNESISLLFSVNVSDANKKRKYAVRSKTTSLNSDIFSYNFYCTSTQDAAKHDWHRISYLVRSQLQLWWPVYNNLSSCYIYIEEKMFFPKIWTFHWDRCICIYMLSRSGGLKVEGARSKAENWGSLMTSSYSANCDRAFWSSLGLGYAGHGVMHFSMPHWGFWLGEG